ncbi:MAG: hypothetical protein EXX96DRAFT_12648 [Benjaminiella poitrasii]|nr:MAG: hypothetical protein EXX96DRAFT_12648 [Benjaminiella poitrasii]
MIREKRLISSSVPDESYSHFGNSNDRWLPSEKFKACNDRPITVDLRFNFAVFIELMKNVIKKARPNLNSTIQLPKDYKKNNPSAKRTDYPKLTGFGALHLGISS